MGNPKRRASKPERGSPHEPRRPRAQIGKNKKRGQVRRRAERAPQDPRWEPETWEAALLRLAREVGYEEVSERLREAMTHRSFANEQRGALKDNQRLEFLGDAIIGSACTLALWEHKPQASEGELSSTRACLINADVLSRCAESLGLDEVLRLGRGEPNMGPNARKARLADAFEALVGALCLDLGQGETQRWVWGQLREHFEALDEGEGLLNIKTRLQHKAHQLGLPTPRYERVDLGRDEVCHVKLWIGESLIAEQEGPEGRRILEERLAELALRRLPELSQS